MVTVTVDLSALGADWSKPCKMAIEELNKLFKKGGKMTKATIGLPKELKFAVPWGDTGMRSAGAGARSVVAGHEIVHALMHHNHNTHLMAQTFSAEIGTDASGDKLKAKDVLMPPLQLSNATIGDLKAAWK